MYFLRKWSVVKNFKKNTPPFYDCVCFDNFLAKNFQGEMDFFNIPGCINFFNKNYQP